MLVCLISIDIVTGGIVAGDIVAGRILEPRHPGPQGCHPPPNNSAVLLPTCGIAHLRDIVDRAERVVVFTGARISTESGIPDSKVIELHGNTTYAHCLQCSQRYDLKIIPERFAVDETLPVCESCKNIYVKIATISFGQAMLEDAMREAGRATRAAGSSLMVHPANSFPLIAKRSGAEYVILNREATDQDPNADLVIHNEFGTTLGRRRPGELKLPGRSLPGRSLIGSVPLRACFATHLFRYALIPLRIYFAAGLIPPLSLCAW